MTPYSTVQYGDLEVCWSPELEGGGRGFGQDYLPIVEYLFGRVDRVFELCAGAGCIGFSLLGRGLCNSLVLCDINPRAVEAAQETVRRNGLEDRVVVYLSDGLAAVPSDERCDLFIANPPFFTDPRVSFLREPWVVPGTSLRSMDPGLRLHQSFYGDLGRFLRPGGSALIQGCSLAQPPEVIVPLIEAGGLQHIRTLWYTETRLPFIYYMWSKRALPNILPDPPDPQPVRVELSDTPRQPLLVPAHGVHVLQLRNLTERSVAAEIEMTATSHIRSLVEIPPGGQLVLPKMALHPGTGIVFRDEHSGSVLAAVKPSSGVEGNTGDDQATPGF